ncbi:MAG: cache domain-containing protein [Spirochaetales bacterium]|nr:cache domain-containing protein [Spirochaetales bacterium]
MKRIVFLKSFNRTKMRTGLSVVLLFITMLFILFYLAQNYRNNLIEFRKRELKRQVEMSLNTVAPILEKKKAGELSQEDALVEVATLVERMTYKSETMDNYIFMSSYDGIMLVQPLEPWLQGTNQLELQDSYGKKFIHNLIDTARNPSGDGFVSYHYPPPGSDNPGEKLSYVKGIPELGCYIGTGMFFNDIDKLFREYLFGPLLIIIIGFSLVYILIIIYMMPLVKCFQFLLKSFKDIALDPENPPQIPMEAFSKNSDEREILIGFEVMIDELQKSRVDLIHSEKRYRYLYEESMGVRIILDKQGVISGTNHSFMRVLGFELEAFNGKSLFEIFKEDQTDKLREMVNEAFTSILNFAHDFDLVDAKGCYRTILFSDSQVLYEEPGKVLITGVDITNRKNAERKAALQKEQLIQADKLASLGVLVSGVAHEINNPNQFILSNTGLLQDVWEELVPVLQDYYKDNGDFIVRGMNFSEIKALVPEYILGMTEGARRIGKIVNDLKTLSRDNSLEPWSDVNINLILESSVNLCSNMIQKATDNFSLDLNKSLLPVYGNAQRLEQVFINLIQNGVQSLKEKDQSISIQTLMKNGDEVQIIIRDTGCGIESRYLKRIFDPFFTTKRESGGTGIGLSISKSIIDEHHGSMVYFSKPGEGTTVRICLPSTGPTAKKEIQ